MNWPAGSELRIGLGCMRLSTDADRDPLQAEETIGCAVRGGITIFDTAHAYGLNESDLGHNERLLVAALRTHGAETRARIVTKGGMNRPDGGWLPDGRAASIRRDCEASLAALDGLAIDLYLLHAPDPRVPWRTSVRALARLLDEGLVRHIGLSNVTRQQLDEALDIAPISAIQVGLSLYDDRALRGGVFARCIEHGVTVIAHSPLGGVRRAATLHRDTTLRAIADSRDVTPAQVALAWLLDLSPMVVAIPGARRPETARSAAGAAHLVLSDEERLQLNEVFDVIPAKPQPSAAASTTHAGDVVVVMGIPGAGKSRLAADYVDRGYVRLNRDERGGSLKRIASDLDEQLATGVDRFVLDNTYLTRALRSYVIAAARQHGARTRCVWLDIPLDQAQVNMVRRLLDRFGALPSPEELRAASRKEPWLLSPAAQMRTLRELEPPTADEGWDDVSRVPFLREPSASASPGGVFVAADVIAQDGWHQAIAAGDADAPHLVFDWRPEGSAEDLASVVRELSAVVTGAVDVAVCPHPAGPPTCWCRPPLPGLPLALAHAHGLDVSAGTLIGQSSSHRRLADTLGARYVAFG